MRTIVFACILAFTIGTASAAESFHPEWLAKDEQIISNLAKLLPTAREHSSLVKALLSIGFVKRSFRNTDFGSSIVEYRKPGGYASYSVTVLTVDKVIVEGKLYITASTSSEGDRAVRQRLKSMSDVKRIKFVEDGHAISYRLYFDETHRILEDRIAKYLGPLKKLEIPDQYTGDYNLLIQPLQELHYGDVCYSSASAPEGRMAIERLIKARRYDLIENVLRAYNPEGRIYALEAILRIGKTRPSIIFRNLKAIGGIWFSRIKITSCSGCFVMDMPVRGFSLGLIRTALRKGVN